jgi:hypothetical protein
MMAGTNPGDTDEEVAAPAQRREWRFRYRVGDLVHYTEWTSEFATVENLCEQYRCIAIYS